MYYKYLVYDKSGQAIKGRLSASSEEAANNLLEYAGYQVVNLKKVSQFFSSSKLLGRFSRVNQEEIILFYRQLAVLLESGINITTSLELLQAQSDNKMLRTVLGEVISDLRGGSPLSTAMGRHPEVFSPICCRSLRVGEQTGGLETMLRQIADYMEKELITSKSIKSALMYPIITALVAVAVIAVLVTFVLPAFGNLYSSLGAKLPLLTRILIDGATFLQKSGVYIIVALLIICGFAYAYIRTAAGRYNLDKVLLSMPLIGRVIHLKELSRCCRNISLLYHSGLPLTEIMPLAVQSSNNKIISEALVNVQQDMLRGEGLSKPMGKNKIFLPMMTQMVKVGEETGTLDTTLMAVAQSYETESENKVRNLVGMIQPVMTLGIAIIVGFIALSMVSAMYSIYGQIS